MHRWWCWPLLALLCHADTSLDADPSPSCNRGSYSTPSVEAGDHSAAVAVPPLDARGDSLIQRSVAPSRRPGGGGRHHHGHSAPETAEAERSGAAGPEAVVKPEAQTHQEPEATGQASDEASAKDPLQAVDKDPFKAPPEQKGKPDPEGHHRLPWRPAMASEVDSESHSIFRLRFRELDNSFFWIIFALMIVFTIAMDRVIAFAYYHARNSWTEQLFVNRVNSEVTMYGLVGIFLFVLKHVINMEEFHEIMIDFVDILCSLGACGLILVASLLFIARKQAEKAWISLEGFAEDSSPEAKLTLQIPMVSKALVGTMTSEEYAMMKQSFRSMHDLPDTFDYSLYLGTTLCKNTCNLMDVKWYTWGLMLIGTFGLLLQSYLRHNVGNDVGFRPVGYLWLLTAAGYGMLAIYLYIYVWVSRGLRALAAKMRAAVQDDSKRHDIVHMPHPFGRWSSTIAFLSQLISLINCFFLSMYAIHISFNLTEEGMPFFWRPVLLFPMIVGLVFIMPCVLARYSVVEAFCSPDEEAMDRTNAQLSQANEDFAYVARRWKARGSPSLDVGDGQVSDVKALHELFRSGGIMVSESRCYRIYQQMVDKKTGTVDSHDVMRKIRDSSG